MNGPICQPCARSALSTMSPVRTPDVTHGLRRGLYSFAASRLELCRFRLPALPKNSGNLGTATAPPASFIRNGGPSWDLRLLRGVRGRNRQGLRRRLPDHAENRSSGSDAEASEMTAVRVNPRLF